MKQMSLLVEIEDAGGNPQFTEAFFQIYPQDGTVVVLENGERYLVTKTYSKMVKGESDDAPARILPVIKLKHKPKKRKKY